MRANYRCCSITACTYTNIIFPSQNANISSFCYTVVVILQYIILIDIYSLQTIGVKIYENIKSVQKGVSRGHWTYYVVKLYIYRRWLDLERRARGILRESPAESTYKIYLYRSAGALKSPGGGDVPAKDKIIIIIIIIISAIGYRTSYIHTQRVYIS